MHSIGKFMCVCVCVFEYIPTDSYCTTLLDNLLLIIFWSFYEFPHSFLTSFFHSRLVGGAVQIYLWLVDWLVSWLIDWLIDWLVIINFADLEYHISQLADIRVPACCLFPVDYASEGISLSPILSRCCYLCWVSADPAVYLWFWPDQWGAAWQPAGQWISIGWNWNRQVWISRCASRH